MRIKWSIPDFIALRHEPGVVADIDSRASRVAAAAGDGYEASSYGGAQRHRGSVMTKTPRAMVSNAKHNTLLKALDAGR